MAKSKHKNLSEHVNNKKKGQGKSINPFEIHLNKEKMTVLGRKVKNDRGLPGVSKAKAIKKRKSTLLQEYKLQNKVNTFMDRRIGERNRNLSAEDRVLARFTAERMKAHNKKSVFNLGDDEVLTHKGQTLNEIEKFDDPRSDDEEERDESGCLESGFVEDAHFGGGVLTKAGTGNKSHKDIIDQLIFESKKRKFEKQKLKEATLELTEKLDTEWKDLIPLVNKKTVEVDTPKPRIDDYDRVMRELRFEARGQPSDRLKTEDELAKEEKEKLEKLEEERLQRMKGFTEKKSDSTKHRSADDLDDNFVYEDTDEVTLSYNEKGESNIQTLLETNDEDIIENLDENNSESEEDLEEAETDSQDELSDLKESEPESESEEEVEVVPCKIRKIEEVHSENSSENKLQQLKKMASKELLYTLSKPIPKIEEVHLESPENKLQQLREIASKELPYTFSMPNSYEELQDVLKCWSPSHQGIIIERIIKCNHPSLGENNKASLDILFTYLLQYINDISSELEDQDSLRKCFDIFDNLIPQLFDLAQFNKENARNSLIEVIKEKQDDFRKRSRIYFDVSTLLYLKLIGSLFTTSDFRNQLVTPCVVFIEQMLIKRKMRTRRDIAYGLFLVSLILEYTSLSKRFPPSAINFLTGILHMAIPKTGVKLVKVMPPFKKNSTLLVLTNDIQLKNFKLSLTDLVKSTFEDDFKIRALYNSIKLLSEFVENLKTLPSQCEIFEPILEYLTLIQLDHYPDEVKTSITCLVDILHNLKSTRHLEFIVSKKQRPKALRLYEPNVQKVIDGKRHKPMSRENAEKFKLVHKIKREHKGALREIRRDKSFLGRVKIDQRIQGDAERKLKVKQIFSEAATQQSELNAMDRMKKRK